MRNRDPLDSWLYIDLLRAEFPPEQITELRARTRSSLEELDRYLQRTPEKGRNLYQVVTAQPKGQAR